MGENEKHVASLKDFHRRLPVVGSTLTVAGVYVSNISISKSFFFS